jgi:hypothetical protein
MLVLPVATVESAVAVTPAPAEPAEPEPVAVEASSPVPLPSTPLIVVAPKSENTTDTEPVPTPIPVDEPVAGSPSALGVGSPVPPPPPPQSQPSCSSPPPPPPPPAASVAVGNTTAVADKKEGAGTVHRLLATSDELASFFRSQLIFSRADDSQLASLTNELVTRFSESADQVKSTGNNHSTPPLLSAVCCLFSIQFSNIR